MPFLERPQLDEAIRAGLASGSVALHGSLGYGKTFALRSALRASDAPVARWETAPWERLRYAVPLVDAIAAVRPDFGRRTRALAEAGAAPAALGAALGEDLSHIRAPLIVAIDDAGDLFGDDDVRAFLQAAAGAAPGDVRFAVASRRETAGLLRAPVLRIDEAALRFSTDEIARLTGGDASLVRKIVEATAGWPASVALNAAPETIPDATRAALEPFAVRERIASDEVAAFRSLGAFVEIDDGAVAMQPAIRKQLLDAMRARGDDSIARAHLAAGLGEESAGRPAVALYHLDASGDASAAYAFLHRNVAALALSGDLARVEDFVRASPPASDADAALASFAGALGAHARGETDAGERFERTATAAAAAGADAIAFAAELRAIESALARGETVAPERMARARTAAPPGDASTAAAVLEGWNAAIAGSFEEALAILTPYDAPAATREGSGIEVARAYAETALGRIDRAKRRMDALVAALESSDRFVLHVQALIWYARFALLWGETGVALDYANEAFRRARGFEAETESAALHAILAEAAAHAGDADAALHWSRELRRHAETAWYGVDARRLAAIADQQTARALFARGDVAGARAVAETSADDAAVPAAQRAALLADAAAYACIGGERGTAEAIARARMAAAGARPLDAVDGVAIAVATTLLDALAVAGGADVSDAAPPGAFAALARARDGSVRLPVAALALRNAARGEKPGALTDALDLYTARGPRFEAAALRALARTLRVETADAKAALHEPLTERESQVLTLLVEGLTNREIGERLILGTRTVETHVERILGKLGVGSRTRAIAAALRLGLVVP